MTGKAHLSISALLCQCFAMIVFNDFTPTAFIIGAFFGLIADIDEPNSKISYFLIKGFGKKDSSKNNTKNFNNNSRVIRQIALTTVLWLIAIGLVIFKINYFFALACIYISYLPWTTHRSLSHSLISSIIVGVFMYLGFGQYSLHRLGIYCGVGYFLHIFEDSFTVSGTPLFYPFSKKRYRIPIMSTGTTRGSIVEMLFIILSSILCILVFLIT